MAGTANPGTDLDRQGKDYIERQNLDYAAIIENFGFGGKILVACPIKHGHCHIRGDLQTEGRIGHVQWSAAERPAAGGEAFQIVAEPIADQLGRQKMRTSEKCGAAGKILFRDPFAAYRHILGQKQVVDDEQGKIVVRRRRGGGGPFNGFRGPVDAILMAPEAKSVAGRRRIAAATVAAADGGGGCGRQVPEITAVNIGCHCVCLLLLGCAG